MSKHGSLCEIICTRRVLVFQRFGLPIALSVLSFLSISYFSAPVRAQSGSGARVLITQNIDESQLVTPDGNTRPEATSENDRGPVANDLRMEHMLLQLRRPPEQEQALQQFIIMSSTIPVLRTSISGSPHSNSEKAYGLPQQDLNTITALAPVFRFLINLIYPSGMLIDFSGTAGQVEQAHTEIHNLRRERRNAHRQRARSTDSGSACARR